jgi:hypothetical protein
MREILKTLEAWIEDGDPPRGVGGRNLQLAPRSVGAIMLVRGTQVVGL